MPMTNEMTQHTTQKRHTPPPAKKGLRRISRGGGGRGGAGVRESNPSPFRQAHTEVPAQRGSVGNRNIVSRRGCPGADRDHGEKEEAKRGQRSDRGMVLLL